MKLIALSLAFTFFAAVIGSDTCFGHLLERGHSRFFEDWKRDGSPTWWTWSPAEMAEPWYYRQAIWRWTLPRYLQDDPVARRLHFWQRALLLLAIAAWGSLLILGIAGYFSN